jgi:RimJ/RimL family protein N-acetyltransferase
VVHPDAYAQGGNRLNIVKAPETIRTERLLLRKPVDEDASGIFERYANDAEVTRFLAWPMHNSIDDTRAFLEFSNAEWDRWPAGPYLICSLADGSLLGSTGLAFEDPFRATTGYVLAKDSWGQGFATEALIAMRDTAADLGVERLYAMCHPEHRPSRHVLEKGGFEFEGRLRRYSEFPNLHPGIAEDVVSYAWVTGVGS